MPILPLPPDLPFLPEDPPMTAPREVLVTGGTPGWAEPPAAVPVPTTVPAEVAIAAREVAPMEVPRAEPTFALPAEDAFPTRAELDAILAAHAGAPAGPDAAEREAAAALLGLDPGIAGDAALYDAALPGLPDADGEDILAAWLGEADTGAPPPEWPDPGGDWMIG